MVEEIMYLFPNAIIGVDIIFQDDGDGVYISQWNLPDPQPTQAEIDAVTAIIQARDLFISNWTLVDAYEKTLTITIGANKYAVNKEARITMKETISRLGASATETWHEEWGSFTTNSVELQEAIDLALIDLATYRNQVFGV